MNYIISNSLNIGTNAFFGILFFTTLAFDVCYTFCKFNFVNLTLFLSKFKFFIFIFGILVERAKSSASRGGGSVYRFGEDAQKIRERQ